MTTKSPTLKPSDKLERSLKIDLVRSEDEADRTVEIAFSSETEVERWFGTEILDHSPQSVRLDRLNNGAAVLVNHDTRDQVGVVVEARIDADRVGRAKVRFSKSQRGEEIYQDVLDGIRTLVSVGYRIHKYETKEEKKVETVRATSWEPFELSFVPIPADASVGVGRSDEQTKTPIIEDIKMPDETKEVKTEERSAPVVDVESVTQKAVKSERERQNAIREMADKNDLDELGRRAISEGWSASKFNAEALEKIGERNNHARAESGHDGNVDLSKNDQRQFSLLRLMDAIAHPRDNAAQKRAAFEMEVSDAAIKGFGSDFKARGAFVPDSVMHRDLSAGTATDGAELVADNLNAGAYIDVLRNAMKTQQAGARMLPGLVGNVSIPRQTAGASAVWISTEGGDATESEPQFDQITMSPKDLACYTEVTRRLTQQSTPAVEGIIRNDLAMAQGLGLDLAVLYGSGSSGQPEGIVNATGIQTKDFSSALPTYAELVDMIKKVMDANALIGSPVWFTEPSGWAHMMTTPKQASGVEGNFILNNEKVVGYDYFSTNQVTTEDFIFGDFSQVLVGEWGGLEINVDPYTKALSGTVRFVTFKSCDVAIRRPQAFCLGNDAQ